MEFLFATPLGIALLVLIPLAALSLAFDWRQRKW